MFEIWHIQGLSQRLRNSCVVNLCGTLAVRCTRLLVAALQQQTGSCCCIPSTASPVCNRSILTNKERYSWFCLTARLGIGSVNLDNPADWIHVLASSI